MTYEILEAESSVSSILGYFFVSLLFWSSLLLLPLQLDVAEVAITGLLFCSFSSLSEIRIERYLPTISFGTDVSFLRAKFEVMSI
jgi:hypothetical protein